MKIIGYFTFPHYFEHCAPILDEARAQGIDVDIWTSRNEVEWANKMHPAHLHKYKPDFWMVAGSVDYTKLPKDARVIYVEHGAGQTYAADTRGVEQAISYSNGVLDKTELFLCPNVYVTHRRAKNHPDAISNLIGVPKLDWLHAYATGWHAGVRDDVVAFAFHWDCPLVEETRSAWEHYRESMRHLALQLRRHRLIPVATAHPRIAKRVRWHAERSGFEWWESDDVLARAGVLCVDNSSIGYEFASLDRPTVWMNAPWYRRDVHHGLRFWEAIPGQQVDGPDEIVEAVCDAFASDPYKRVRDVVNAYVNPLRDGRAAERAVKSILALR